MSQFYSQVKNPKWANAEHTAIDCEVDFGHLNDEFVPFTADPTDVMEYSKTIFDECVAGNYGPIAEYVAPPAPVELPAPTKEQLMAELQALAVKIQAME
jgi:hypothetical protein